MEEQAFKFRSFFAIDIPKNIQKEIAKIICELKGQNKYHNLRWSKPENLHLTIRFLGNISLAQCEKIIIQVQKVIRGLETFSLSFDDLIIFPSSQYPVVLALKPEPLVKLLMLNQLVEKGLSDCNVQEERRVFSPHLTLAKVTDKHIEKPGIKLPKLSFAVNKLQLYRSDLTSEGSKYSLLASMDF